MAFHFSRHIPIFFLTAGIVACGGSDNTNTEALPEVQEAPPTTEIIMNAGKTQCNDDGLTLEEVRGFLAEADITPIDESCGTYTGLSVVTLCGANSLSLYMFTIELNDLDTAENIGFYHISDAIDEENGVGVERIDC